MLNSDHPSCLSALEMLRDMDMSRGYESGVERDNEKLTFVVGSMSWRCRVGIGILLLECC